jgi:aryl-alcohol dehydrogenase-like predicted oxidoreductase/CheY-like chemotaxis protein
VALDGTGGPRVARPVPQVGMGCMRLSTERDRDETRGIDVLHAAFDAGIRLLDTSDAYCLDAADTGHNERLIARAIETWSGDRSSIRVATKGGLTRPAGRWVTDGRARHLAAACEASLRALGIERLHLYQLHAPDPRTPFSTSIRALAGLKRDGCVENIGLCNVTVGQIEEARQIAEIASVQVELSAWHPENVLSGVVAYCFAHGIPLLAYRPLGGPRARHRTLTDPALSAVAQRHNATPFEIALAWLASLSDLMTPLPGPTRVETAQSIGRANQIVLSDDDRVRLEERFAWTRRLRAAPASGTPTVATREGEVVLVMGIPGAGKSTVAATLAAEGYERLNRDEAGGSLSGLVPALDRLLAAGSSRIVLDNTYVSRKTRAPVIEAAHAHGLPVRCIWLSTSIEDAQVNAAWRIVSNHGRLLSPEEIRRHGKRDMAAFGPGVQFRYQRELEPPAPDEGFTAIDIVAFERRRDPSFINRAVIVWCDGVLREGRSGEVFTDRADVLRRYQADGWLLLGLSWQPGIADETTSTAEVDAGLARMQELLGLAIEVEYCPHAAGPPTCWCRKPLPGLGVLFIQRHRLDPSRCIYVGSGAQDPGFARRLGFEYRAAVDFFAAPAVCADGPGDDRAAPLVLIVDDFADALEIYGSYLTYRGYRVLTASTGADCIELARTHRPDLILLDIRMPVMTGIEALRLLRADAALAAVPVVALTADALDSERDEALAAGFDQVIAKPCLPDALFEAIAALLAARRLS